MAWFLLQNHELKSVEDVILMVGATMAKYLRLLVNPAL